MRRRQEDDGNPGGVPENAWRRLDHPELRQGEVFLSNGNDGHFERCSELESIRMGQQAYDIDGKTLRDAMFPFFVAVVEHRRVWEYFEENRI